jgi:glutamine amidotransferase
MIAIIDYGLGNVQAFVNIYRRLGIEVKAARTPADLVAATKLVLPGVGAFDWAMDRLNASGLREALDEAVLGRRVDVLGVCVGMQMMALRSEEGKSQGLGWIDGDVVRFDTATLSQKTHLPHIGWNDVQPVMKGGLFQSIEAPRYYFLHSYFIRPSNPATTLAMTHYGQSFTSAIRRNNIFGTQFHPEKSHGWGVQLLRNFAELAV